MLRNGQRVQIDKATHTVDGKTYTLCTGVGKITTVTSYDEYDKDEKMHYYYVACLPDPIARNCLYPIDDEPCEAEFLEQFTNLIKEKECT